MSTLSQSAPLGTLGLTSGDHWVKFHVEGDAISFEVKASVPGNTGVERARSPTGFVQKWGGSARRIEDDGDEWLTHINRKHLR